LRDILGFKAPTKNALTDATGNDMILRAAGDEFDPTADSCTIW
jgi:hypothetical protein